jgi:hypothetical protein
MNKYCHQISGFFLFKNQAETAYSRLIDQGIKQNQLKLHRADFASDCNLVTNERSNVFTSILLSVAFGVAIGSIAGMLADLIFLASNNNVYATNALITPTVLLGWCAGLGGLIGLVTGSIQKKQILAQMSEEAFLHGQFAVVVETHNHQQTSTVKSVMTAAVGGHKNIHDIKVKRHSYE